VGDFDPGSGRRTAAHSSYSRLSVRCFESRYPSDRVAYPRDTGTTAVDKHRAAKALASLKISLPSAEWGAQRTAIT
jgi:hypothetical protein